MKKLAVIGAGLSGLTFAHHMKDACEITIFEKSRGIGGRMATRYAGDYEFDHGAQYFTAKGEAFQNFLKPYIADGLVVDWAPQLVTLSAGGNKPRLSNHPSYVASPRMNSLAKELAKELSVRGETHLVDFKKSEDHWQLFDKDGNSHGPFDYIVLAIPSHQAADLLPEDFASYDELKQAKMDGCFSVMLGFEDKINFGFDGAFVEDSAIGWMAVNHSKPGRPRGTSLLVQSRNDWAEENINDEKQAVMERLIKEASQLTGKDLSLAQHQVIHRWLYASTSRSLGKSYLLDESLGLASIGDWCIKGRVEAAFDSGFALAQAMRKIV